MSFQNMPPVPPMHFPPQHANNPAQVVPQARPQDPMPNSMRPIGPHDQDLLNRIAKLQLENQFVGKGKPIVEQDKAVKGPPPLDNNSRTPFYEGWTFYRADSPNGDRPNWNRAYRKQMHVDQDALLKKVRDGRKKKASAEQYQNLGKLRRAHVDDLINEHERKDLRFQWTCVFANVKEQELGRRGAFQEYETLEMNVVLMRKPKPEYDVASSKGPFGELVDLNAPPRPKDFKPNKILDMDPRGNSEMSRLSAFGRGPIQGTLPAMGGAVNIGGVTNMGGAANMNGTANAGGTPHAMRATGQPPESQNPFRKVGPDFMMAGQIPSIGAIPEQQKAFYGSKLTTAPEHTAAAAGHKGGVGIEVLNDEMPFPPRTATGHVPPQSPIQPKLPFAKFVDDQKGRRPQANMTAPKILHPELRPVKSPKVPPAPEPGWISESSSVDDDDSMLFEDDEDYSSATEDLDEEKIERHQHPRGSLHSPRRSSKRWKNEASYRVHYRRPSYKTIDGRRHRYSISPVDIFPESSLRSRRESGRTRLIQPLQRARPRVHDDRLDLHEPILTTTSTDIAYLNDKARDHWREREYERREYERALFEQAMRHRMLDEQLQEREDSVRRRELDISYREKEQVLSRRYSRHEPLPLRETLAIREPLPFRKPLALRDSPHPHVHPDYGYYARDDMYNY